MATLTVKQIAKLKKAQKMVAEAQALALAVENECSALKFTPNATLSDKLSSLVHDFDNEIEMAS